MGNKKKMRKELAKRTFEINHITSITKPRVSVCTPTYNRRPFINAMIRCFEHQDYPMELIEWIIVDDGTDKIEELVTHIPQVKYFKYDKKMTLGAKRNLMHAKTSGDIIVYMDDDDYYPPDRISHAVKKLQGAPNALCAGSSELFCYFKRMNKMYKFGPYGPNHATAGTFAFKRKLLDITKYEEDACLAEEKQFLHEYTIPFVQLDPLKTILVFSHDHNTFDKRILLKHKNKFVNESNMTADDFIGDATILDMYMNEIPALIADYAPGRPDMKPDVQKQLARMTKEREEMAKRMQQQQQMQQHQQQMQEQRMQQMQPHEHSIDCPHHCSHTNSDASDMTDVVVQQPDESMRQLSTEEVVQILEEQQSKINELTQIIEDKNRYIKRLELVSS
tara:strand:- start:2101 stop:3273 length:1173 start_codon:yes stop_codon:yes gene_type:complete